MFLNSIKGRLKLAAAALAVAAITAVSVGAEAASPEVTSAEMKMLVNTEIFANKEAGFGRCLDIISSTAANQGIKLNLASDPFDETNRLVQYMDTENLDLTKKNYVLRQRIKTKKNGTAKANIMLKYRVDMNSGAIINPSEAIGSDKAKLEMDLVGGVDGVVGKEKPYYSVSVSKKKLEPKDPYTIKDLAEHFQKAGELGIPADTRLVAIGGNIIDETKIEPCTLEFAKDYNGDVSITVWEGFHGGTILAEVSYSVNAGEKYQAEFSKAKEFFTALQQAFANEGLLEKGHLKDEAVYELKSE